MLMVELRGGNLVWWTRDVAQRLVGRHLTKPHSEQWTDEAMQESAAQKFRRYVPGLIGHCRVGNDAGFSSGKMSR